MFGYKLIKKETIENYENEILSLKGKLTTSQEALSAEIENSNSLLNKFAEATRTINELRDQLSDLQSKTPVEPVERKPRKRTTKKKVEEKVGVQEEVKEEPKKTQKKKRTYKKKNEKKSE